MSKADSLTINPPLSLSLSLNRPRIIDLYYILLYAISPSVDTDSDFNKIESIDRIEYVAIRLSDFTEKEQEEIRSGLSLRPLWRLPP